MPKTSTKKAKTTAQPFPRVLQSGTTTMTLVPARALLHFRKKPTAGALRTLAAELGLIIDRSGDGRPGEPGARRINDGPLHVWVHTKGGDALGPDRVAKLEAALGETLRFVAPAYQRDDLAGERGIESVSPDALFVRGADDPRGREVLGARLAKLGLSEHAAGSKRVRPWRAFGVEDPRRAAAYELAAQVAEHPGVTGVGLHTIRLVSPLAGAVYPTDDDRFGAGANDDEAVGSQWSMKRIGAPYAWGLTTGSAAVTLYLFDQGVQFGLTDLPTFRQFTMADDSEEFASQPNAGHGTAMAGILAAPHASSPGGGMAGLAPDCPLVSLRAGAPISNADLATAINHVAGDAGGTPKQLLCLGVEVSMLMDALVNPILHANLPSNCLLCVPVGDFLPVDVGAAQQIGYAAWLATQAAPNDTRLPNVMLCGMTDRGDAAAHYDVWKDNTAGNGSKYGPELSVVAPGVDITSLTPAGAYAAFTGTSAATAHVAGLAALAWSADGSLGATTLRTRLEHTAAKTGGGGIGGYAVAAGTNALFNDHMGFGRADASAVLVAQADGRADVYIRDSPTDDGTEPSMGWWVSDVLLSTTPTITNADTTVVTPTTNDAATYPGKFTTPGSAVDTAFTTAVAAGGVHTQVSHTSDNYVFVRVKHRGLAGSGGARGVRVSAVCAACSTGFVYPTNWDKVADDVDDVVALPETPGDDYVAGPLPLGAVVIFRLKIDAARAAAFAGGGFGGVHACCLPRVVACNDLAFTEAVFPPGDPRTQKNNLTQRNLSVV